MAIAAVPPLFPSIAENQSFSYEVTFVDGVTQIPGPSLTVSNISINLPGNAERNGFPPSLTATVVKYATSSGLILSGFYPKLLNDSDWSVRTSSSNTNIVKYATYEEVKAGYYAGVKYRADSSNSVNVTDSTDSSQTTSVFVRVDTNLGTVFIPQTIFNNWTRKRNQVIPFVQGGRVDVNTNRFPGGTLGGAVGQDIFEPAPATGQTFVDVLIRYETPGPGTFTVPVAVSSITLRLTGAGGAGGDAYASKDFSGSGAGGGSGGYLETTIAVQTGQVFNYTVGAGGDRTGNRAGGATSFSRGNVVYSVTGGGAGGSGLPTTPGQTVAAGGTAGSPIGRVGAAGRIAYTTSNQVGGRGADMFSRDLGTGGDAGTVLDPAGKPGTGFGAGGGGAATQRGTIGPWPGGAGAPGRIELRYRGLRFVFIDNITTNTANYNLAAAALAVGWDGATPLDARITVAAGIYVYSTNTSIPAFSYTGLPTGSIVSLTNLGFIIGKGGRGGDAGGGSGPLGPEDGGPAIILNSVQLNIVNSGYIAGGGGGGGGRAGGGGGAGGGNGGAGFGSTSSGAAGTGGNPGSAGSAGGNSSGTYDYDSAYGAGGGGGRILPGAGGAAGTTSFVFGGGGGGGGAGGGGGGYYDDTTLYSGAAGGAGSNPGASAAFNLGGGGGGGWGAAGGGSGGRGGKAIDTRGFDVAITSTGTIYGAISGSSITGVYSTAIVSNQTNFSLRPYVVGTGWDQNMTAVVTIAGGTYVYSTATATPGLTVDGVWPNGIKINNYGFIIGMGGNGSQNGPGGNGGPAMSILTNIAVFNEGYIAGGGGGGGGAVGGGGGGAGGGNGANSSAYTPGQGTGGAGGAPGQAGANGTAGRGSYSGYYGSVRWGQGAGGGGGRILPGVGGAAGTASGLANVTGGGGGGAGGGGGGHYYDTSNNDNDVGNFNGGAGGSAGAAGGNSGSIYFRSAGGGGGGWGAAGGRPPNVGGPAIPNSIGGRAVILNGNVITYFKIGTIYGSIV